MCRVLAHLTLAVSLALALAATSDAFGSGSSKSSTSKSTGTKTVHVKGYTTKSGKYVAPHERAAPGTSTKATTRPAHPRTEASGGKCATCPRDTGGRIARSETAKHDFMVRTGYPHGRPGYVIDHIVPLACGGADAPWNMQWQTEAAARAKDKTERRGCSR